jgi:hypothetical protein
MFATTSVCSDLSILEMCSIDDRHACMSVRVKTDRTIVTYYTQVLEHGHVVSWIGIFRTRCFPIGILWPSELPDEHIEQRGEELSFRGG